ncbi:hypothetical protein FOL47_005934 [Perkinsus chesapeaki]|uniref:Uncharacterized protein n=1 Tax=Perkinsus chesapeaki TaxID=330153 RepID=A0A7J6LUQ4_PERCH|nr:hypothetical protein FOL47_005934 [Perkinsus chesapeaki]
MSSLWACRSALLEHSCDGKRSSGIPSLLMDAFKRGKDARILGPRGPIGGPKVSSKLSLPRKRPSHGSVAPSRPQCAVEKKSPAASCRKRRELRFGPAPESVEFPGPDAYSPSLQSTGGFANSPRWSLAERYSRGGSFDMYGVNVDIAPWSYNIPSTMQICPKRRRKAGCETRYRFPRILSRSPGPCAYTPSEMRRSVSGAWDRGVRPGMALPEDDFTPGPGTYNTNLSSPSFKMATIGRAGAAPAKCSLTITEDAFRERGRRLADVGSTLNLTSGRSFGRARPVRGIPSPESGAGDLGPGTYGSFLKHHAVGKLKSWTSCQGRNPPGSRWMESCLDSESEDEEDPC